MTKEWSTKKIKEFCEFKYGKNLPADKRVDGPYPVYGSSSIASYHEDYLIEAPGLIIGRKGTVGKVQLSKENYFPIDTTFYVDKTCTKENIYFLYYFFQLCGFEEMNSDAAVPGLNRNAAVNLKVKLPPIGVQNKIAAVLSSYDALIENNQKRIKLLEEMAQITYEEWFVRMKFPGYETAVFDEETGLPEGWAKRPISDFCEKITDGTHDSPKQVEQGVPLITGKHIENGFINFDSAYLISYEDHEKIKKRSGLSHWDILFSNIGTLGNTGVVTENFEYSCKNVVIFKRKYGFEYFLYSYLSNEHTVNKLDNMSSGVAQKFYSLKFIRALEETLPSDDLIKEFNTLAEPIYAAKFKLNNQIKLLKEARDTLLPRLMTGMIDIEQVELPEAMLKRLEEQEDKMATA